ncbi:MAG TPA: FtsX-like permease family protein, partial [Leptolinea sp.]
LILQIFVGLLVPLLAASFPILRSSRISVREAISDYGIAQESNRQSRLTRIFTKISNRPFMLSLRNTFRKRGRLILTLGTLALGGAGFITAMNVSASMNYSVDSKFDAQKYDIQMTFTDLYPAKEIEALAKSVEGVKSAESWGSAYLWGKTSATIVMDDGTESNRFMLNAPPANTNLITTLPLVEGRWLEKTDTNTVVINHALLALEPEIAVGDTITLKIAGKETPWKVIGVVRELMGVPGIYVNKESLDTAMDRKDLATSLVVVADHRDVESVARVTRLLENKFSAAGFEVDNTMRLADTRKQIEDHLLILATFLVMMSLLVLLVGGLGLASTMSINVLERTREIGVMRAIGASTRKILQIIVTEGTIIGGLSWVLALAISWPVSVFVSNTFGMTFFEAPLKFAVSLPGIFIWLAISICFAAASSLYPAWSATQLTVRQILAYE